MLAETRNISVIIYFFFIKIDVKEVIETNCAFCFFLDNPQQNRMNVLRTRTILAIINNINNYF